ncbi:hypothetical protein Sango_2105100 [Sesamum angolense]|uniref:Uncharacterized protein n=1 Tax=Sesamum angolense TaxID=2727404 RepID=A0AAE1WBN2_9LAMI|nr:hypothetical protein Sango_2105100 [Sesamum angolense]
MLEVDEYFPTAMLQNFTSPSSSKCLARGEHMARASEGTDHHTNSSSGNPVTPGTLGRRAQNVLPICDFDMNFTYVYTGWEGSAADARVLSHSVYPLPKRYYQYPEPHYHKMLEVWGPMRLSPALTEDRSDAHNVESSNDMHSPVRCGEDAPIVISDATAPMAQTQPILPVGIQWNSLTVEAKLIVRGDGTTSSWRP